jgi:hypothetical protein
VDHRAGLDVEKRKFLTLPGLELEPDCREMYETDDTGKLVMKLMFMGNVRPVGPVDLNGLEVRG